MTKSTLKMVLMLGTIAVLLVSVAGCTSPNSTSATNNAQAYAKAFATNFGENQTVKQTTIVANGTDGAQVTLLTTNNGSSSTSAFNIRQFSSVADATAFYNAQSFGYVQVGSNANGTLDPNVYSSVTGHNPTTNTGAVKLSGGLGSVPMIFQQDEFVTWGTVSSSL